MPAPFTPAQLAARLKAKTARPGSPTTPVEQIAFDTEAVATGYFIESVEQRLTDKANGADLADVAFSGSYNDLTNKPAPGGNGGLAQAGVVYVAEDGDNETAGVGEQGAPFATLNAMLDATANLPYVVVRMGVGRFAKPDPAKMRSNIAFLGAGNTAPNHRFKAGAYPGIVRADAPTKLVGGTIIEGTFDILPTVLQNVTVMNIGVDVGPEHCTSIGSSGEQGFICAASVTHPDVYGLFQRTGMFFANIKVLCINATASVHGFLLEQCIDPVANNIHTIGGFAGFVSKCVGGRYSGITTDLSGDYTIILKNNPYATSYMTSLTDFICRGNGTTGGLSLYNEGESGGGGSGAGNWRISNGQITNCAYGIRQMGSTLLRNISIQQVHIDNVTGIGVAFTNLSDSTITNVRVDGATIGFNVTGAGVVLDGVFSKNCSGRDIKVVGTSAAAPVHVRGAYCLSAGGIEYGANCTKAGNTARAVTGTATAPSETTGGTVTPPDPGSGDYDTPPMNVFAGMEEFAPGRYRRTAPTGDFSGSARNNVLKRTAGTAARFGFKFLSDANKNGGAALDVRNSDQAFPGLQYFMYVGGGQTLIVSDPDGAFDTGHTCPYGASYFYDIDTTGHIIILETMDEETFTPVTLPRPLVATDGDFYLHICAYSTAVVEGLRSFNFV